MHNTGQKAQHRTQTKGDDTQGALQRPRREKFGHFQQHSLLTTPIGRMETAHSPEGNTKRSHRSLRPKQSGDNSNGTFFFLLTLFVHASYDVHIFSIQRCGIKVVHAGDKDRAPPSSQGQRLKHQQKCEVSVLHLICVNKARTRL